MSKIFLTIQTKGGAGKSTIAQQILSTYFLAKKENVSLVEIDDENLDSSYLTASKVKSEQLALGSSASAELAIESLMPRVGENLVIDVGGNRTATNFIDAARKAGFFTFIDAVVIPISAPGQDEINAMRTIDMIKTVAPDTKIIIAVTRQKVRSTEEFDDILQRYFNVVEMKSESNAICYLPQIMAIAHARHMGLTLFEMAVMRNTLLDDLSNRMVASAKNGKMNEAISISRLRASVAESGDILPFIEQCHAVIESVM